MRILRLWRLHTHKKTLHILQHDKKYHEEQLQQLQAQVDEQQEAIAVLQQPTTSSTTTRDETVETSLLGLPSELRATIYAFAFLGLVRRRVNSNTPAPKPELEVRGTLRNVPGPPDKANDLMGPWALMLAHRLFETELTRVLYPVETVLPVHRPDCLRWNNGSLSLAKLGCYRSEGSTSKAGDGAHIPTISIYTRSTSTRQMMERSSVAYAARVIPTPGAFICTIRRKTAQFLKVIGKYCGHVRARLSSSQGC
jgi:hypothetical protein